MLGSGYIAVLVCPTVFNTMHCCQRTVIDCSKGLQASAGAHEHDATTLRLLLYIMNRKRSRVDHTYQIDVHGVACWFLQLPVLICFELQVVGTGANAGIGENTIDLSMLALRFLEQCG